MEILLDEKTIAKDGIEVFDIEWIVSTNDELPDWELYTLDEFSSDDLNTIVDEVADKLYEAYGNKVLGFKFRYETVYMDID